MYRPDPAYRPNPAYEVNPAYAHEPIPPYQPEPIPPYRAEPVPKDEVYNTFDRATTTGIKPKFQMHTQYSPRRDYATESKPPLYGRSMSQTRNPGINRVDDMYNRRPPQDRYTIANSHNPDPQNRSPLRRTRREASPHFQRPRSASRPATDFEIHDAVKTLFR